MQNNTHMGTLISVVTSFVSTKSYNYRALISKTIAMEKWTKKNGSEWTSICKYEQSITRQGLMDRLSLHRFNPLWEILALHTFLYFFCKDRHNIIFPQSYSVVLTLRSCFQSQNISPWQPIIWCTSFIKIISHFCISLDLSLKKYHCWVNLNLRYLNS